MMPKTPTCASISEIGTHLLPAIILTLLLSQLPISARSEPATVPPDTLRIVHLQNAGVWIGHGGCSAMVDALFDLTVAPGLPPRLHDHLSPPDVSALLEGRLPGGCVDAAFATHDHDDHHQAAAALRYRVHCPQTVLALPAAIAPAKEEGVVAIDLAFGEVATGAAGPVRYTALGLRHGGEGEERPHLGFVIHAGPWDVMHLGDAAVSPANLELLDRLPSPRRRVLLAPYWFLTEAAGRAWLRERSRAQAVVLLHANRGNVEQIERDLRLYAPDLPPLVLPRSRLETVFSGT